MTAGAAPAVPPAETTPEETLLISVGAATAVVGAVGSLLSQDLVGPVVACLALLVLPVAAACPVLWPTGRPAVLRARYAQPVVVAGLVLAAVVLVQRLDAAGSDPGRLVGGIGGTLGPLVLLLVLGQLAGAVTVRHLAVVLVGAAMAGVLAIASTGRAEQVDVTSGLGLGLLVTWTGVVPTLWLLHRARTRLAAHAVARGSGPAGLRPRVATAVLLVAVPVALAVTALLLPKPSGLDRPVPELGGTATGGLPTSAGSGSVRSPEQYVMGDMDLGARGELPTTELVVVPDDSPSLWAGSTLTVYTGRSWQAVPAVPRQVRRDAAGDFDLRSGTSYLAQRAAGQADREDLVRPLPAGLGLPVLAPGEATSVRSDDLVLSQEASGVRRFGGSGPYVVGSVADVVDPVQPADLVLPAMPARVRDLAWRLTRDAPTVEAKVAAVEAYLHAHARYDLDSPVPDDGEDAVDDFLFESHEGFCEHFASAEAVLLRLVGVPTRVVTGFAGGEPRRGERVLRGSDAHAWVQVNVGGDRWVWTDPTAGAVLAEDHDPASALADWLREHRWPLLAVLATAGLAGALAWSLARRARRRRAAARAAEEPLSVKVLAAFGRLETALAPTPLARGRTASVTDWTRALARGLPAAAAAGPGGRDRLGAASDVVQRVLYDRGPVRDDEALRAVDDLAAITAVALAYRDSLGPQHVLARGWRWLRSWRARRSGTWTGTPKSWAAGPSSPASSTTRT